MTRPTPRVSIMGIDGEPAVLVAVDEIEALRELAVAALAFHDHSTGLTRSALDGDLADAPLAKRLGAAIKRVRALS